MANRYTSAILAPVRRNTDVWALTFLTCDSGKAGYAAMNETYRSYFAESRLPARTCVGVTGLAYDALIEIDLVARRPA